LQKQNSAVFFASQDILKSKHRCLRCRECFLCV